MMRSRKILNLLTAVMLVLVMVTGLVSVQADTVEPGAPAVVSGQETGNAAQSDTGVKAGTDTSGEGSGTESNVEGEGAGTVTSDTQAPASEGEGASEGTVPDSEGGSDPAAVADDATEENAEPSDENAEPAEQPEAVEEVKDEEKPEDQALLEDLKVDGADADLKSGYYTIYSGVSSKMVLDINKSSESNGAASVINASDSVYSQTFYVENLGGGLYTLRNCNSDMMLGISGDTAANGTAAGQYKASSKDSQKWYITVSKTKGYYTISSALNKDKVLDVKGGTAKDGSKVQLYGSNNSKAQIWKFAQTTNKNLKILSTQAAADIKTGYYMLKNNNSGKVLDIKSGSTANGANVDTYAWNKTDAQAFHIEKVSGDLYKVTNLKSGKALDVAGGSTAEGANVQQYKYNKSNAQLWHITKSSNSGYYTFRSATGDKVLTASGTSNGSNVCIKRFTDSAAQKWSVSIANENVANGYYVIKAGVGTDMVLDVRNASSANGADINIVKSNGTAAQEFVITKVAGNLYKIQTFTSGKVVELTEGKAVNGSAIRQYTFDRQRDQLWYITKNGNGTVNIRSALNSNKVLDVAGAKTENNSNVIVYDYNGSKAQSWTLEKVNVSFKPGVYTLNAGVGTGKVVDIKGASEVSGANVQIYKGNGTQAQKFAVEKLSDGSFTLTNIKSRKVLEVAGGKAGNGKNVRQATYTGSNAQKWKISYAGGGAFKVVSKLGNYCLDIAGGSEANGANVQIYTPNGSAAQKFKFTKASTAISNGKMYTIKSALNPEKVLDVKNGSLDNSANVDLYATNNSNAQKWFLKKNGNYYMIVNVCSGKVLDVKNGSTANGANVQQYANNKSNAQKWKLVDSGLGDGSYYIVNYDGKYLDIAGGSTANGTNVQQYKGNKSKGQRFYITDTEKNANGWYTAVGKTYYYKKGKVLTGLQSIAGVLRYFDENGVMLKNTSRDGYNIDANGVAVKAVVRIYNTTAKKTIKTFLSNALKPVGQTLYIWGGGWNDGEGGTVRDASIVGTPSSWQSFFKTHGNSSYDYTKYRYSYGNGLDCSGFVGWSLYNTLYKTDDDGWTVYQSSTVAGKYAEKGWTVPKYNVSNPTKFYPGDVVSMDGHVWISMGQCADGSIVVLHSSPKGVQISGTAVPKTGAGNSQAHQLADKYMKKYFSSWPYATRSVGASYYKNLKGVAHWKTSGGLLTDPDGIQKMTAPQVLNLLLGPV